MATARSRAVRAAREDITAGAETQSGGIFIGAGARGRVTAPAQAVTATSRSAGATVISTRWMSPDAPKPTNQA